MAAAMSLLSPINGRRLSGLTSVHSPSPPCIQSGNRARARVSESFSSLLQSSSGNGTSFLLPLSSFSKEKKKRNNNFLPTRNASLTPQAQWEAGEEEEEKRNTGRDADGASFYVGNLPYSVNNAELLELFNDAGNVSKVEVIYNKDTGRSRGFAFVTMANVQDVSEAVERFNGYEYRGRTLRVSSRPPPVKNNFTSRVGFRNGRSGGGGGGHLDSANQMYVGNLPWGADNYTLEQLFKDHGKVKDVKVVYDRETGRSRGFGFVTMSSSEEVEAAISSLDGADMDGRPLRVRVA